LLGLTFLLALVALPAEAHGTLPGGDGFYAGALHPFVALEHLLALFSVGLILGRDGLRRPLWPLAIGLCGGIWLGAGVAGLQVVLLAVTLLIGVLLALQSKLPEGAVAVVLLVAGAGVGMDTDLPRINLGVAFVGLCVSTFLITMNAFALGAAVSGGRGAIVLRVAGAWMVAVSLMVLALHLRGAA
jgi:hydrogenase/urease accessory protein HupE